MRRFIYLAAALALVYVGVEKFDLARALGTPSSSASTIIGAAYRDRESNIQVFGAGEVARVLSDDTEGSRHQRFILRLETGQTLLVAHNIDLAPRVVGISDGDTVEFSGEYEWNDKGGVLHWTHHDPQGVHSPGWLKHNGRTYH